MHGHLGCFYCFTFTTNIATDNLVYMLFLLLEVCQNLVLALRLNVSKTMHHFPKTFFFISIPCYWMTSFFILLLKQKLWYHFISYLVSQQVLIMDLFPFSISTLIFLVTGLTSCLVYCTSLLTGLISSLKLCTTIRTVLLKAKSSSFPLHQHFSSASKIRFKHFCLDV